tara:strand:+ start:290 stop:577 length:288 start_codon:yes stop_codon:yes gene_type:complete
MTQKISFNLAPRGLNAEESARYIGISKTQFLQEVKEGKWEQPDKSRPKRRIWDRKSLDRQLDKKFNNNTLNSDSKVVKDWVKTINYKRSDQNEKT